MVQDWSNADTAKRWDGNTTRANPLRTEQLDILLTLLENSVQLHSWILDLGYGSGQIEELVFERIPHAKVVGVDNSDAMMTLAKNRLAEYSEKFVSVKGDLSRLDSLELPACTYGHVIAVQSLHHLSREQMQAAYRRIYDLLEPGGLFVLLDRMRVETFALWSLYRELWKRQDKLHDTTVASHEGATFQDHERIVRDRGDFPALLDDHLVWLRQAGFEAACLHAHGNRALIAGKKV
ncbi:class I SAM-dependent methyltransferase [Alicyclobacillus tolerans]|uniref:class I SAM-dependent methyltransferase n=1 Tax=Alicyclobacillus tolerans TaxID=90970 RepID=UPI001F20D204|nr:class I SAM-dependent methyltransferase [Alicyclobacillus tolerans]MCF8567473.1 class I SAM-dependent methyltransferase [Alicyclobacillus tolerans]